MPRVQTMDVVETQEPTDHMAYSEVFSNTLIRTEIPPPPPPSRAKIENMCCNHITREYYANTETLQGNKAENCASCTVTC
jgi:hypothetical protein